MTTMTTPASSASKRARLTLWVRTMSRITPQLVSVLIDVVAGVAGIVKKIRDTVGDLPVYLSIDVRDSRTQ